MAFKRSFRATSSAEPVQSDGRNLTFIANSGKEMDNGQTVDLTTLKAPLMDGSYKLVSDLEDGDKLALPLLIDHMPSVNYQAGKVTKLWLDNDGMMATAKLSKVDVGEKVLQLAQDGALTNSFSISIEYETAPGNDGVIRNATMYEISVVFKGMDPRAGFKNLYSKDGNMQINMEGIAKLISSFSLDDDEKQKLLDALQQSLQSIADSLTEAIDGVSENGSDEDPAEDDGENGTDGGKADTQPQEPNQSSNQKKTTNQGSFGQPIIITPRPEAKGKVMSSAKVKAGGKTYLDSPQAFDDFAKFVFDHPTDSHQAGHKIQEQWRAHVTQQLSKHASYGIDPASVDTMVPTSVLEVIQDAFNNMGDGVWKTLKHTGLDTPPTIGENEISLDGDNGRAHGYGVSQYGTQKTEEQIGIKTRTFKVDMIYKYITLNAGDLRRTSQPSTLLKYVLSEMPSRLINTMERAAIINSVNADGDWKDLFMFRSIYDDSLQTQDKAGDQIAGNRFALTYTQQPGETLAETFNRACAKVRTPGAKYLVTSDANKSDLVWSKDNEGRPLFPIGNSVESTIGVQGVFTPEWWFDRDSQKALGVIYTGPEYMVFGDDGPTAFTNFALRTNENEFLQEIYAGGGLRSAKSAVVIKPAPTGTRSSSFGYEGNGQAEAQPQQ